MLLTGKNAVIYGAAGGIGAEVARTFAREGATVHLTGRTKETLDAVAETVPGAQVAVLDAFDEDAVEAHAETVGRIDVSLNLVPRGDVQGTPLIELSVADFTAPVTGGLTTAFITARAAARRMTAQGSGVILALNSGSAASQSPGMGGTGPADGAIDSFIRNLAVEVGPHGVRALGVWVAGIPETLSVAKLAAVNPALAGLDDNALAGLTQALDGMRLTKRSPTVQQVAETITFLASDRAGGITGTFVNVTSMFTS